MGRIQEIFHQMTNIPLILSFFLHSFSALVIFLLLMLLSRIMGSQTLIIFTLGSLFLGNHILGAFTPCTILSFFLLSLETIFLFYLHLYARKEITYSLISFFFFSVNIMTPISLIWGFIQGLSLDKLPLESISDISRWRHLILFLWLPLIFIYPFLEPFFSPFLNSAKGSLKNSKDSIYFLLRGNPRGDDFIYWLVNFLGKHQFLRLLFLSFHFFLLNLIPFLHSLLWLWVFWSQDLLLLLRALPLLLFSFLYGHISHYLLSYLEVNFRHLEKILAKKEISPGIYKYFILGDSYPEDFLPSLLDGYFSLRKLREKLHLRIFIIFPRFHLFLLWLISTSLLFFLLPHSPHFSAGINPFFRSSIKSSFPLRGPCEAHFSQNTWRNYLQEKSKGVILGNHPLMVDTSIRDSLDRVLLLGELTSSPFNGKLPTYILDGEKKVSGEKGIQYWIPCEEITFIDPKSLASSASILFYFQRESVKKEIDFYMSQFGISQYSQLKHPSCGFSRREKLLMGAQMVSKARKSCGSKSLLEQAQIQASISEKDSSINTDSSSQDSL